nr:M67 family metallopeptidase [Polymorphobacter sp.]
MMIVTISSGVAKTLVAEAAKAAPNECCGLLLGTPGHIETAVPARNTSPHPDRAFEIDPVTLLRTHREARGQALQVLGHYHSHPNASPEPSLRDAARAVENGQLWLIIADSQINAWHTVATDPGGSALHGRFLPVMLEGN